MKLEPEEFVEERLARLESDVQHIQSDISDIKGHLLRVDGKIDALAKSTSEAHAALVQSISEVKLAISESRLALVKSTSDLKIWWLATLMAAIVGSIARALKWI